MSQTLKARGILTLIAAAALIMAFSSVWTADAAAKGYTNRQLWLVRDPGGQSPYVEYYVKGAKKPAKDIKWEDGGHTGKAVSLSGNGESLEIGYYQLQMHTMTFSGWFKWRGAAKGMDADSMYSQRLLTISHSKDRWLTVMPHAKDPLKKDESGKILDGVYMAFKMGSGKDNVYYEFWNPAEKGMESYGIPVNEWHHIALTMDGEHLRLYIDGRLWFERLLILGFEEMKNNTLSVGGGRWGDSTLNALVDDMVVYNFAMSGDQIGLLGKGIDPLNPGSTETTSGSSAPTTAPTQTSKSSSAVKTLFGLPVWTFWLTGGLILLFVALSVFVSVYKPSSPSDSQGNGGKGGGYE